MSTISFAVRPMVGEPDTVEVVPVVDGRALTDLIHAFELEAQMESRGASYVGLVPAFFRFGPARVHYTASQGAFVGQSGKVPLLGCACGEWGCWPLLARVNVSPGEVEWTAFEQPFRPDRDYSAFGPFRFARDDYEGVLSVVAGVWDGTQPPP